MEDTNESEVTAVEDDNADRAEEEKSTYNTHSPDAHKYDSGDYVAETWRRKNWEKMDFQLPLASVGTLIGAGGETIQSIERLCRSSIRVDRESITDTGSITISVTGPSKAAVDWAKILSEAVTEHRVSGKQLYHMDANDEAAWDRLKRKPAELRQGRQKSAPEESESILEQGDQLDNTDTQGEEDVYKPRSKNWAKWSSCRKRCRRRRCTKAALRRKIASLRCKIKELEEMWYYVRVQSPVTSAFFTSMASETQPNKGSTCWESWCPCCKRPLDISIWMKGSIDVYMNCNEQCRTLPVSVRWHALAPPRYAYVASIWGSGPGFVLGALVLGRALRRSSVAGHDIVLLHTDALSQCSIELLSEVWIMRRVEYVDAHPSLFVSKGHRFDGCFTKLHALGLTEYTKILMLDLDLAIMGSLDELFQLPAPAALNRGSNSREHGSLIDGRRFFGHEEADAEGRCYEWGQAGGINAGVMLLEPNRTMYRRALREVVTPLHPEHVPGNGPEQDYLSRLYAPWWSHIGVAWNFQLHHVFFAMEHCLGWMEDEVEPWLPSRLKVPTDEIQVVHFSGELKMWDREVFYPELTDEEFAEALIKNCSPVGYKLWIKQEGEEAEYAEFGVRLAETEDGKTRKSFMIGDFCADHFIDRATSRLRDATISAAKTWRKDFLSLPSEYPNLPRTTEALLESIGKGAKPPESEFSPWDHVEVQWGREDEWFPAIVKAVNEDLNLDVDFLEPEWRGKGLRSVNMMKVRALQAVERQPPPDAIVATKRA